MSKGSVKTNKLATSCRLNNVAYSKNAASRFGNGKNSFKQVFKTDNKVNKDK